MHSAVGSNLGRFRQLGDLVEHLGVVEHEHACKGEQLGIWEAYKGQQGGALEHGRLIGAFSCHVLLCLDLHLCSC